MTMIVTIASRITNRKGKEPTINNNNNTKINKQQVFKCLINTRLQNTTININIKQMI